MRNTAYIIALLLGLSSCKTDIVNTKYQTLSGGIWSKEDTLRFTFQELDTVQQYDVFINVRNDDNYPFSNLFLITSLTTPKGEVLQDTLEYNMALSDGTWLGRGNGSIKENKLWYKENIVFPSSGVYTLEVMHAMRKNGNVSGIVGLEGITDVGIEITKSTP
ncbi:gliding motility lipoprotein GldH [Maribacter aestuarii]|uniref:gliding motility lipoprotein GldH n=1 Tax=Maribacter aestuarii TaxID=1130723 RepID=UPI0025A65B6F|nr:gliding motility lipoprotein GldH [Maribacter aestuarii]